MSVVNLSLSYDPYEIQHITKRKNREKILRALEKVPLRFTDLQKITQLSPTGLTKILKDLVTSKKIKKTVYNNKQSYILTKKGRVRLRDLFNLGESWDEIKNRGGKHYWDYTKLWGEMMSIRQSWGIFSAYSLDKNLQKFSPLSSDDVFEIEELIYQKIRVNIKRKKIQVSTTESGHIVVGFDIDYTELIKSIHEYSLDYYKNATKEEIDLISKIDDNTITDKEHDKYLKLKEKTMLKIRIEDSKQK